LEELFVFRGTSFNALSDAGLVGSSVRWTKSNAGGKGTAWASWRWWGWTWSAVVGGTEVSDLDVGELDAGVWRVVFDVRWLTGGSGARASWTTPISLVGWVSGVQPKHVGGVVVPDAHDENHTGVHGLTHLLETTLLLEIFIVSKGVLDGIAHFVGDGVKLFGHFVNSRFWVLDDFVVLDVKSSDLDEVSLGGLVRSMELSDDGEWLGGVDLELSSWAEEVLDADSVGVEITTIWVTDAAVSVGGTALFVGFTSVVTFSGTWMSGVGGGDLVGFPDVHLTAAGTPFTGSAIWVGWVRDPVEDIGLSVDELDILWALSITISSTVGGTSLVSWVLGSPTIGLHFDEIEGTVDSTWHV